MNYYKKLLTVFILLFSLSNMEAQVATLDSRKIMASLPEMAKADTLVMKERQKYQLELDAKGIMAQKLATKADSLYKKNPNDKITVQAIADSKQEYNNLKKLEEVANKKIIEYRNVVLGPYFDKINSSIKSVAIRLKYKQVIDIQSVALVWLDPAADITEEVINELKKK